MEICKNCEHSEYRDDSKVFCIRYQRLMNNFDDCNKNLTTKQLIKNVRESARCDYGIHK